LFNIWEVVLKHLIVAFILLGLMGCAHHRNVRPGASGIHTVVVVAEDKEEGSEDAIKQANHFCEQRNKVAAFVDEKQQYTGDMSESDYKKGKTISKVAKAAGGAAYVFGGKRESDIGGVVGLGGVVGDAALGEGYTVTMKFKCQ
jgi:hypothetical protein